MLDIKLQNFDEINQEYEKMNDVLEYLKVARALNCELFKLDYRMKNKPNDVSPLDYTVIAALTRQIPTKVKCIEDKMWSCPTCYNHLMWKWKKYPEELNDKKDGFAYCTCCGQRLDWE